MLTFPLLTLLALGCATSKPDRAVRTTETLTNLQEQATTARSRVDTTLASLNNLLSTPPESLRGAYDQYNRDLSALDKSAASIRSSNGELHSRTDDYFKNWQKDSSKVTSPELQAIADQRRQVVRDQYDRFRGSYGTASTTFDIFLKDLHDISTVLGNDLTASTQAQVRGTSVVQSATNDGAKTQSALDAAIADARALSAQLAPTAGN